jgi:hypothetical protein
VKPPIDEPTTPGSRAYFGVWDPVTNAWQTSSLVLDRDAEPSATFLLNVPGVIAEAHDVSVSFECANSGGVRLIPAVNTLPALTAPAPGRARPDTTALSGSVNAWSATFSESPVWAPGANCSQISSLRFTTVGRRNPASFTWAVDLEPGTPHVGAPKFTAAISVDGAPAQTITANFAR